MSLMLILLHWLLQLINHLRLLEKISELAGLLLHFNLMRFEFLLLEFGDSDHLLAQLGHRLHLVG